MNTVALLTELAAYLNAKGYVRFNSDIAPELERVEQGTTRYALVVNPGQTQYVDSNRPILTGAIILQVSRGLTDYDDERAWTGASMQSDLEEFADPTWWRSLVSVADTGDTIEVEQTRVGYVVTYTVSLAVSLAP